MQGLRRTRAVVGLDLGTGAVKLVELARGRIRSSAFVTIRQNEASHDRARVDAIQRALHSAAPRANRAVVGLDASEVIVHRFTLPLGLPDAEIEEQARMQAVQSAPLPLDEICYDYVPEGKAESNRNYRMAVVRASTLKALCKLAEDAGLKAAAVDVTAFAVERTMQHPNPGEASLLMLDGGFRQTRLTLYGRGEIEFRHSQPFGCSELAGRLQRAYGLTPNDVLKSIEECSRPLGAASRIRDAFLVDLARHVRRGMQLCLDSRGAGPAPEQVVVWGGAALLHGVCGVLEETLGLPVSRGDACAGTNACEKLPAYSPALLGACALARNDHV